MFVLTVDTPQPEPEALARAREEFALVIEMQCRIRRSDLLRRREVWIASQNEARNRPDRFRNADIARVETSLKHLVETESDAAAEAGRQLPALLRELGGLVAAYDLGQGCLGVRVPVRPHDIGCRALLLPERSRRIRIQMQPYGPNGPPQGVVPARQVCLGIHGDRFVDLAFDRMHLPTFVLAMVSYVRTNVVPSREE